MPHLGGEPRPGGRLADHAYAEIKAALLSGRFPPGQRLPVDALVAQLRVSRQPVMDALKRLAAEGFLEIIPQVGCRVVVHDRQEIADFFRLFASAAGLSAELAASRRTEAELAALAALSAEIEALRQGGQARDQQAQAYRLLNRQFHSQLRAMARSTTVAAVAASLWDRADFYIGTAVGTVLYAERLDAAHGEHERVRRAIERRHGTAARRAMEEHVLAFAARATGFR